MQQLSVDAAVDPTAFMFNVNELAELRAPALGVLTVTQMPVVPLINTCQYCALRARHATGIAVMLLVVSNLWA